MPLPDHKTKIVATIGPASDQKETLERLIGAGMNIARLNFSHGDFSAHAERIARIRAAERDAGHRIAIMADLPGPKMRVGTIEPEPIQLRSGDVFTLTTDEVVGNATRVSISFERLPRVVKPGDRLFLNDGIIQLQVEQVTGSDVQCKVAVGGELRSRKGLNLPGIDLGESAFTERDRECLRFALQHGVDAVSQSFVGTAADVEAVRAAAAADGFHPFVIAKIERALALDHLDEIMRAADGVMVARGDLGVEIPIERIPIVQKHLIYTANVFGKPVITATQMLESMVEHRRPTRAEATDVANAILDGTDAVMLSGESAMGAWPVEAVEMLARIAAEAEPHRSRVSQREILRTYAHGLALPNVDLVAVAVTRTFELAEPAAVIVPTVSGATARSVARFRLPVWTVAVSVHEATCQALQFSYGVHAVQVTEPPDDWSAFARGFLAEHGISGRIALLTEGPSARNPHANNRMEIIDLTQRPSGGAP